MLNLTVQDGLKSNEELAAVLLKCKSIVRYVRSSCIATAKLREEQERVGDSDTMEQRHLYAKKDLGGRRGADFNTIEVAPDPSPVAADDIMLIEDVVEVLEPFE
ncbi:hypothetical protein HPB50_026551 [Hyalomma asiaticum]|uniref:Uncharacterized protein n=1 Tax=Hyalomma asiaticum TaxID=266040 RepID=A0ACB7TP46_HYAAI|nr:hypothetical protein HPB50_026551 [Hyalomma asiaticum]